MKIASATILYLAACLSFSGCAKKQDKPAEQNAVQQAAQPFVPPVDSAVSPAQMAAWFACNAGLDSLSMHFTQNLPQSGAPSDSAKKLFCLSQDSICVQNGLKSGYAEYRWITDNLGKERNKAIFDSVRAKNR